MITRSTYDRPREKLLRRGQGALTSRELVQLILGSGSQKMPIERLAKRITRIVERGQGMPTMDQLTIIQGIGLAKAAQIVAALELAQRLHRRVAVSPKQIAQSIERYFIKDRQIVYVLFDGSEKSIDHRVVETGTPASIGRALLRDIIDKQAAGIYIAVKTHEIDVTVLEIMRMVSLTGEWLGLTVYRMEVFTDAGREVL